MASTLRSFPCVPSLPVSVSPASVSASPPVATTIKDQWKKTGESIDKAAEKTGEVLKDGAQKTGEAIEKAGEKVQEAVK